MFKTTITLAALVIAVLFAASPTFAKSGREGGAGGAAKVNATPPVNKPAGTPKSDKSTSNLMKNSATGKHYQQTH
jgi:hypothetical protein